MEETRVKFGNLELRAFVVPGLKFTSTKGMKFPMKCDGYTIHRIPPQRATTRLSNRGR